MCCFSVAAEPGETEGSGQSSDETGSHEEEAVLIPCCSTLRDREGVGPVSQWSGTGTPHDVVELVQPWQATNKDTTSV